MISRRNIRVKVMQALYALETMDDIQPGTAAKLLQQNLTQTTQIYTYLLYFLAKVAQYAEKDAQSRASRRLKTEEDMQVNIKIAGNTVLWQLLGDQTFLQKLEEDKLQLRPEEDLIKKLYLQLVASAPYAKYIAVQQRIPADEKRIMSYLFNDILMKSEPFDQHMEDTFLHWQDDKAMMDILVNNYFQKPQLSDFGQLISAEKMDYATELLQAAIDKKEYCLELIRPKLQNWDAERIASIDMLLMEMGICEFLYFPTIPTKVTINEYIDLAKVYSTPQSGQFVNGILDNILKELEQQQKIHKTDRARK